MITLRKERFTEANYLDFTLKELLDTKVKVNLLRLIIKHMQRVLLMDEKNCMLFLMVSGWLQLLKTMLFLYNYGPFRP